jgi:hypothetical protein
MGKHLEDDDAKTCMAFWVWLYAHHDERKEPNKGDVDVFLAERAAKREASFNKPTLAQK